MKEKFSALYAKEGTKKVISSLISILAGLLVGGIVVIVVGAFNSKISGSGIWDGIRSGTRQRPEDRRRFWCGNVRCSGDGKG